ncbi:hypothetical protein ABZW18_07170 [Streptomyces sp. NPDC004647]|uniref:hypothetical protein n=1 Tax=Streptomyces sp. NPDC004647 TaxID=3154671 RepID=UPI0033B27D4E
MATSTANLSISAAARRLAGSEDQARQVEAEWWERGIALLPVGPAWDAVKLPDSLVRRVAAGDHPEPVRAVLAEFGVTGPVFLERDTYYVLVPPGTAARWDAGAECITTTESKSHYMGIPSPAQDDATWSHWVIRPDADALCSPAAVRALIQAHAELGTVEEAADQ